MIIITYSFNLRFGIADFGFKKRNKVDFKSVYGLKESEELKYRLNGKLRVAGGNGLPVSLPFESEGQVTLPPSKDL